MARVGDGRPGSKSIDEGGAASDQVKPDRRRFKGLRKCLNALTFVRAFNCEERVLRRSG
jgi:hypothetical protein